jgi:hypothetical protein
MIDYILFLSFYRLRSILTAVVEVSIGMPNHGVRSVHGGKRDRSRSSGHVVNYFANM